eukprot:157588-Amphidinium_carterae.1
MHHRRRAQVAEVWHVLSEQTQINKYTVARSLDTYFFLVTNLKTLRRDLHVDLRFTGKRPSHQPATATKQRQQQDQIFFEASPPGLLVMSSFAKTN